MPPAPGSEGSGATEEGLEDVNRASTGSDVIGTSVFPRQRGGKMG